jgi:hypothetical protein
LSDESLFREVDEEVRQEQFKKVWARYGSLVTAVAVAIVVAVAGLKGWEYWQRTQAEAAGTAFLSAVKLAGTGKPDEALKGFESVEQSGYAVLARLRQAGVLASQGKADEAVKIYDAVAADGAVVQNLRDLARIRAAMALVDTAKPEDLTARVKDFDVADNPWRHAAREVMAVALWRVKDYAGADNVVQAMLADTETPAAQRLRATVLSELLLPVLPAK